MSIVKKPSTNSSTTTLQRFGLNRLQFASNNHLIGCDHPFLKITKTEEFVTSRGVFESKPELNQSEWKFVRDEVVEDTYKDFNDFYMAIKLNIWPVIRIVNGKNKKFIINENLRESLLLYESTTRHTLLDTQEMKNYIETKTMRSLDPIEGEPLLSVQFKTYKRIYEYVAKEGNDIIPAERTEICISTTTFSDGMMYEHCRVKLYKIKEECDVRTTFEYLLFKLGIKPGDHPIMEYLRKNRPEVYLEVRKNTLNGRSVENKKSLPPGDDDYLNKPQPVFNGYSGIVYDELPDTADQDDFYE